jgi:hypothetical protein
MLGTPDPARCAPAALTELAQPLPADPALPQGQAVAVPSPEQKTVDGVPTVNFAHTMSNEFVCEAGTCVVVVPSVTEKVS